MPIPSSKIFHSEARFINDTAGVVLPRILHIGLGSNTERYRDTDSITGIPSSADKRLMNLARGVSFPSCETAQPKGMWMN